MALGEPYIGDNCIIEIALQQQTGNQSWDGTVGDLDALYPLEDGVTRGENMAQKFVSMLHVDRWFEVNGVKYITGTLKFPGSYSYMERLWWLAMMGALTTTGAADPWTHSLTLGTYVRYGLGRIYRTDINTNTDEIEYFELPNLVISSAKFSVEFEAEAQEEFAFIAEVDTDNPHTTAALPAVSVIEPITWDQATLTLGGVSDYAVSSIAITENQPFKEGVGAMNITDAATSLYAMTKGGVREISMDLTVKLDNASGADTNLVSGAAIAAGSTLVFSDGGTPAHTRTFTFGPGVVAAISDDPAGWGEQERAVTINFLRNGSYAPMAQAFANARETILIVTP